MWLVCWLLLISALAATFSKSTYLGWTLTKVPLRKSHSITTSNKLSSFANCSGCFQGPNDELARLRKIRWSRGMISVVWTGDRAEQGRRQGLPASSETHASMGLGYAVLSWIISTGLLSPETDAINTARVRTAEACFSPHPTFTFGHARVKTRGVMAYGTKQFVIFFKSQLDSM
jgi:hypothetical protein